MCVCAGKFVITRYATIVRQWISVVLRTATGIGTVIFCCVREISFDGCSLYRWFIVFSGGLLERKFLPFKSLLFACTNWSSIHSAHTVLMCFVFIWEQTATCATFSINWLVFITEMKSVYSAVRTGSLNKAVCASYLKPAGHVMHHQFNIQQLYVLRTLYLCVLYLSENKQRLVPLTA